MINKKLTEMVKEELKITSTSLSPSLRMRNDDEQTDFYSYSAFMTLLTLLSTVLPPHDHKRISHSDGADEVETGNSKSESRILLQD